MYKLKKYGNMYNISKRTIEIFRCSFRMIYYYFCLSSWGCKLKNLLFYW